MKGQPSLLRDLEPTLLGRKWVMVGIASCLWAGCSSSMPSDVSVLLLSPAWRYHLPLRSGVGTFSVKGQMVNILDFADPVGSAAGTVNNEFGCSKKT